MRFSVKLTIPDNGGQWHSVDDHEAQSSTHGPFSVGFSG
jgi:hypothetical protein